MQKNIYAMSNTNELIRLVEAINAVKGKDAEMREKGLSDAEISQVNDFEFDLENYPPLKKMKDLMKRMESLGKKN